MLSRCSIVYGTPTMHIDLLNEMAAQNTKKSDINVKLAVTAGAFCPAEIFRRMRKNLADFVCVIKKIPISSSKVLMRIILIADVLWND
jgi:acyl-CoA synthetase (AMP-forming)/AMP-acid ligase II